MQHKINAWCFTRDESKIHFEQVSIFDKMQNISLTFPSFCALTIRFCTRLTFSHNPVSPTDFFTCSRTEAIGFSISSFRSRLPTSTTSYNSIIIVILFLVIMIKIQKSTNSLVPRYTPVKKQSFSYLLGVSS